MKPCGHNTPVLPTPPYFANGCRVCYLYETDPAYRALWDNQPEPATPAAVRRALPCVYLGKLVLRARCLCPRLDLRHCDKGHGQVSQVGACEMCGDYAAEGDAE
jgi:hypothetical protein